MSAPLLSNLLSSLAGKPLDLLYSRLGGVNGQFFSNGWGNLAVVNLQQDVDIMSQWPPQELKIAWKNLGWDSAFGQPCRVYEGTFNTPCVRRIWDALPPESRIGRVRLMVPPRDPPRLTGALHLAATGDHGFERRLRLGAPLLAQGVATLALESPFYGRRRPPAQRGAKLLHVADLLTLGWATIAESLTLLHWMEQEGYSDRGICGLSMGGVHAGMTAGLYPGEAAVVPLLAPRSAAVAYCDGAFAPLTAWGGLLPGVDGAGQPLQEVVTTSSQPVGALREAARVRELLEQLAALEAAGGTQPPGGSAEWQAAASRLKQHMQTLAAAVSHTVRRAPGQQQEPGDQAGDSVTRPLQALSNAILQDNSSSSSSEQASKLAGAAIASIDRRYDADYIAARASGRRDMYADATNSRADTTNTTHSSSSGGGGGSSQAAAAAGAQGPTSAWRARREAALEAVTAAWGALAAARPGSGERAARVLRLKQVLETYTDVTRYPRPRRPDAAVLVAAVHDAYVALSSVQELHAAWPGSELRLVPGGHVSAFLLHQDMFRSALSDALNRLQQPPPAEA